MSTINTSTSTTSLHGEEKLFDAPFSTILLYNASLSLVVLFVCSGLQTGGFSGAASYGSDAGAGGFAGRYIFFLPHFIWRRFFVGDTFATLSHLNFFCINVFENIQIVVLSFLHWHRLDSLHLTALKVATTCKVWFNICFSIMRFLKYLDWQINPNVIGVTGIHQGSSAGFGGFGSSAKGYGHR